MKTKPKKTKLGANIYEEDCILTEVTPNNDGSMSADVEVFLHVDDKVYSGFTRMRLKL